MTGFPDSFEHTHAHSSAVGNRPAAAVGSDVEDVLALLAERLHRIGEDLCMVSGDLARLRALVSRAEWYAP